MNSAAFMTKGCLSNSLTYLYKNEKAASLLRNSAHQTIFLINHRLETINQAPMTPPIVFKRTSSILATRYVNMNWLTSIKEDNKTDKRRTYHTLDKEPRNHKEINIPKGMNMRKFPPKMSIGSYMSGL